MRVRRSLLLCLLLALPLALLPGCERAEPKIVSYPVEHPDREKMRMLTAIVPTDGLTFVIKLSGPEAEVAAQKKAFDEFVHSTKVEGEGEKATPAWKVPAGWKDVPGVGRPIRFTTYRIDAPRPLEVVVSMMPPMREDRRENSLSDNVNRWLGQLDLPAASPEEIERLVQRVNLNGREVITADWTGTGVYRRPMEPTAAPANPHAGLGKFNLPQLGKANKLPFRYTAPDAWKPLRPLPPVSSEAFHIDEGGQRVTVTISMVGGSVVGNVERWRGQLKLPNASETAIKKDIRTLRVAGNEGHYVDLANPAGGGSITRILGVLVPTEGTNLVIKMYGPDQLVGRQKANLEAFVESFQPARE